MQKIQTRSTTHSSRYGFTMVEILVVIGILALLTALLVAAIAPALENAKIAATKTTITQLSRMIDGRIQSLLESDRINTQIKNLQTLNAPPAVAEAIARMHVYRIHFPQRLVDMYGLDGDKDLPVPATRDDSPLLGMMWDRANGNWKTDSWYKLNSDSDPEYKDEAESSELMYVFLSLGAAGGISSPLNLDQINSKHIGDTDGDGNLEFLDAWGKPLQFFNWPTELFQNQIAVKVLVSANVTTIQSNDPFDPLGVVSRYPPIQSDFQIAPSYLAKAMTVVNYKTPNQFWAFMIISGGPDQETGFGLPNSTVPAERLGRPLNPLAPDAIYDNITNRQQ